MSYTTARRASAVATSFVAFISYLLTVAPSITFWRSSELAAAVSNLGLPEPPAASLWLLVARVAHLLYPGEAAEAAALFSALCSAATAGLIVLIVCALVERWQDDIEGAFVPAIGGGVVGGLAFAWTDSQWHASTIASTEPFAVLLVAMALLLTLRWSSSATLTSHARLLIAAAFVMGLVAGVDVRLLVIAPAIASIVFFRTVEPTQKTVWTALAVAVIGGWTFDRLVTAWLPSVLDGTNWFVIIGVPALIAILLGAWRASRGDDDNAIAIAGMACVVALLGASSVLVIPIRGASQPPTSAFAPEVDAPVSRMAGVDVANDAPMWPRRTSIDPERRRFQDRYGAWTPSAIDNPLDASIGAELRFLWHYQISHMFVRYVQWNFVGRASDSPESPPAWFTSDDVLQEVQPTDGQANPFPIRFFALPLLLAAIGCIAHFRRDPRYATSLALLFVLAGAGLVVSISMQQPQARERDAVFLVAYFVVALWIGLGAAALASWRRKVDDEAESVVDGRGMTTAFAIVALVACAAAAPVNMLVGGWTSHFRAQSVIAREFAYNLLQSCDSNAVLLTAGDNDTFPLIYLQDAEAIRRDVRVVNLRMTNDPVYLRRIASQRRWSAPPLSLSIVDTLAVDAGAIGVDVGPPTTVTIEFDGDRRGEMTWVLRGPAVGSEGMQMLRLQDHVVVDLLRQNRFRRPIYFSSSVPASDRAGLDAYLIREGLAVRILPTRQSRVAGDAIDIARMRRALLHDKVRIRHSQNPQSEFSLEGIPRTARYLEPEERRVISLYRQLYLLLAERELADSNAAAAIRTLRGMEQTIPSDAHPMPYWMSAGIASLYTRAGETKEARRAATRAVDAVNAMGSEWRRHPHARAYHPIQTKAQMLALLGDHTRAIETYEALQARYPGDPHLRGQLEELRIERHLSRRDTASALAEIDAIILGYAGSADPAMQNNASAFRELADELRGVRHDEAAKTSKRSKKKRE